MCSVLGTLIGVERAVAVKSPLAFAGPFASGLAGAVLLMGSPRAAAWLVAGASAALVGVSILVIRRQRAAHTALLLVAAFAWMAGSGLHAVGAPADACVPWWFAFLILTVAAERLEMTRLMRRRPGALPTLLGIAAAMLVGAGLSASFLDDGNALFGSAIACLAVWLMTFDIARRTVRANGLSRYMALCLLPGYAWLFVGGICWVATALGLPARDAALHGIALGFLFSMMLGHAPVILPAVARIKVQYGWWYYAPLAVLHASLAIRLLVPRFTARGLAVGAAGNALAVGAFIATVAASAVAWRLSHPSRTGTPISHGIHVEH